MVRPKQHGSILVTFRAPVTINGDVVSWRRGRGAPEKVPPPSRQRKALLWRGLEGNILKKVTTAAAQVRVRRLLAGIYPALSATDPNGGKLARARRSPSATAAVRSRIVFLRYGGDARVCDGEEGMCGVVSAEPSAFPKVSIFFPSASSSFHNFLFIHTGSYTCSFVTNRFCKVYTTLSFELFLIVQSSKAMFLTLRW
jgi:hypothetical protein